MKPDKSYSLYQEKEITKEVYHNDFNKGTVQNGYYIYEFC